LIYAGGWTGYGMRQAAEQLIPIGFRAIHRQFELESDAVAARTIAALDYDPTAFVRLIERLPEDPDAGKPVATMPSRTERISALEVVIQSLPARVYPDEGGLAIVQE